MYAEEAEGLAMFEAQEPPVVEVEPEHYPHRRPGHHDEPLVNGWCCVLGQFRGNFCEVCDDSWPCAVSMSQDAPQ